MDPSQDLSARLAEIQDALLALPDDAFAEKYDLLKERDKLRDRAAEYSQQLAAARSDRELLAELAELRRQMKHLEGQRIDLVSQAGSGSVGTGEMGNLGGLELNAQIMEAGGVDRLRSRIAVVTGLLEERGVDIPG